MMANAYGDDLRRRVIAAVDGGMSRSAAAARFEVGKATAIAWLRAWREDRRGSAKPRGGDKRSHRIEAFGKVILAALESRKDITLDELVVMLERDHGQRFARSTVHRFFARHGITFKKRRPTPASKLGRTWNAVARHGSTLSLNSTPSG